MQNSLDKYIEPLKSMMEEASQAIMEIYNQDFLIHAKDDSSPLTAADLECHRIITTTLRAISDFPILSEEGEITAWDTRKHWDQFWLIDPIDGTKEFINKNNEFTINVALIKNHLPILGVVSVPAQQLSYFGIQGKGAWIENGHPRSIHVKPPPQSGWKVIISRSHASKNALALADFLPDSTLISMGSSLKLCAVAEGSADIYPRFGPTSEWDIAAAQAVVEAAGGCVLTLDLTPLRYNTKESLINPYFIACSKVDERWHKFIKQYVNSE